MYNGEQRELQTKIQTARDNCRGASLLKSVFIGLNIKWGKGGTPEFNHTDWFSSFS